MIAWKEGHLEGYGVLAAEKLLQVDKGQLLEATHLRQQMSIVSTPK